MHRDEGVLPKPDLLDNFNWILENKFLCNFNSNIFIQEKSISKWSLHNVSHLDKAGIIKKIHDGNDDQFDTTILLTGLVEGWDYFQDHQDEYTWYDGNILQANSSTTADNKGPC